MGLVYCANCGKPGNDSMASCLHCGESMAKATKTNTVPDLDYRLRACTMCKAIGLPRSESRGSFLVFVVLCFFFIAPGIIYAVWWMTSTPRSLCSKCGAEAIVPIDSPAGKQIASAGGA